MSIQVEEARATEILRRLLRHTSVPESATARTYSSGEVRTINVPSRTLVQAIRLVRPDPKKKDTSHGAEN